MKIKISNPNPYQRKVTNPETGVIETINKISYLVTGDESAVAQYREDQLAEAPDSVTADDGKPLIHFNSATAVKYGLGAELERTIINGRPVWFMDNEEDKQLKSMLAGASTITQSPLITLNNKPARKAASIITYVLQLTTCTMYNNNQY